MNELNTDEIMLIKAALSYYKDNYIPTIFYKDRKKKEKELVLKLL